MLHDDGVIRQILQIETRQIPDSRREIRRTGRA